MVDAVMGDEESFQGCVHCLVLVTLHRKDIAIFVPPCYKKPTPVRVVPLILIESNKPCGVKVVPALLKRKIP